MRQGIKWLVLKYHRYVTLISENRFVNWRAWPYIEMEWNEFGDLTKVLTKITRIFIFSFLFIPSLSTFHTMNAVFQKKKK